MNCIAIVIGERRVGWKLRLQKPLAGIRLERDIYVASMSKFNGRMDKTVLKQFKGGAPVRLLTLTATKLQEPPIRAIV